MDNQEFDQLFSGRLQEEQDFGFREADWEEIAPVLATQQRKGWGWWSWLLLGLLSIALMTIYTLAAALKETKEQVTDLQQVTQVASVEKVDTIFNQITITTYDTIVKTTIKKEVVVEKKSESDVLKSVELPSSNFSNAINNVVHRSIKEESVPKIQSYENSVHAQAVSPFSSRQLKPLIVPERTVDRSSLRVKQLYIKPRRRLFKKRLKFGLTNAWGFTQNQTNIFYQRNSENSVKSFVFDLGLRAEMNLTANLRIQAAVMYDQVNLTTPFALDSLIEVGIASGGFLEKAKVRQQAWHYELGLMYVQNRGKKWTPYGGLTVAFQSALQYRLAVTSSYSYQQVQTTTVNRFSRSKFRFNSIRQFFGYEYQISDRFTWQIEQWYRLDFWRKRSQMYGAFGIRNTVLYRF